MSQSQSIRYLLFAGFLLNSWCCQSQDDRFLDEVPGQRIERDSYVMVWDSALHLPKIISYEVTRDELERIDCGGGRYHADPDLNAFSTADYEGAADVGFEKGHLLPTAHGSWNEKSCLHTSYYSNILPQSKKLNHGAWYDADLLVDSLVALHGRAYVHAGPLPYTLESLPSGIPVPIGFWKLIIYQLDGAWTKDCYLFSQYPYIGFEEFNVINSKMAYVNGRWAYSTKEKALEQASTWQCRGYDIYDFEDSPWYMPCEDGDMSRFEKLNELACDVNLLEEILGFDVYDHAEAVQNSSGYLSKEEMMVKHQTKMLREYGESSLLQTVNDVQTQLGQQKMISVIRRATLGCGPHGIATNSPVISALNELIPAALEPFKMK